MHEFKPSEFHTCCGNKILTTPTHSQLLRNEENCRRNLSCVPVSRPRIAFPSVCRLKWLLCVLILRSTWFSLIIYHLLIRGGEGNRQFWIGKVLDYPLLIQGHHQIKPYIPGKDRTKTIVFNSCLNFRTYWTFYWIMLCSRATACGITTERDSWKELALTAGKLYWGIPMLYMYFCGGGGLWVSLR